MFLAWNEIKRNKGMSIDNSTDKTMIFDNVYTNKDKNIYKSCIWQRNVRN